MRHVIIGNGPAGVIAAEALRSERPADEITLVGDEPEPPYSRMAIPYLLMGNIGEEGTHLRKSANHFSGLRITLRHASAKSVDTQARTVTLNDGEVLPYDRLLLATGSSPADPPIPGIHSPSVMTCWTLADARKIAGSVQRGAHVVLLGAGFIGCIIMQSIAARDASLTVVEMGDRVLPRMMPAGAAVLIKKWCENKGVRILTGTRAVQIDHDTNGLHAHLENGETLHADVIISATGVRPNIAFLSGSGIKTENGIIVDDYMHTSATDVYAAGDCNEAPEFATGKRLINAIQLNAADEARVAALNMAGRPTRSQGSMALNVLDTFGLISTSFGQWQGVAEGEQVELSDEAAFKYVRLAFKDDVLIGATCLGLTEHIGVIRGLIQSRSKLGRWKAHLMQDPTQVMAAYLAAAQDAA